MKNQFDYLVAGSGIAGLTFALKAAKSGTVAIVTKKDKLETNTNYAQGGIACVLGQDDSFGLHVQDTLESGDGLCHPDVVDFVVQTGPDRVRELVELGVAFNPGTGAGSFDLGREGGHSRNRILHAQDMTGKAVEKVLIAAAESEPNIAIFENHLVLDLVIQHQSMKAGSLDLYQQDTCRGAYVLDIAGERIHTFVANAVVLCTGGAGKVYLYTSNPDVATGDGLAIAYRAGAKLANLEFVQFHPTCLYHPAAKNFLISEAVRGEGAQADRQAGTRLHGEVPSAKGFGVSRHRGARNRHGNENKRRRLRFSGHYSQGQRISHGTVPQHLQQMPVARNRHHERPYSGRSGSPLHVRRNSHQSLGAHHD